MPCLCEVNDDRLVSFVEENNMTECVYASGYSVRCPSTLLAPCPEQDNVFAVSLDNTCVRVVKPTPYYMQFYSPKIYGSWTGYHRFMKPM